MLNKLKSTLIILILSSISAIISFMDDPHIFLMFPALIAEIYAICELIKWWKNERSLVLPTAIISTICIIPTAVAMIYQKKLFASACLAFALIAAIMFRVYFKRKKKAQENEHKRMKWYMPILAIILLIPTVAGSLLWVDGIRSICNLYFPVIQLVSPNIRGYEYYSSGKFTTYRYGDIAAECLPKQQELSEAISTDFYHNDLTLIETCFLDTNVQYFLRVEYPSDVYTEKSVFLWHGQKKELRCQSKALPERNGQDHDQ